MENTSEDFAIKNQYMTKPPSWLTRWGMSFISIVFIVFILIAFIFPIPNTIESELTLTKIKNNNYIGVGEINSVYANDLYIGQKVSIHLYSYPYNNFGSLIGEISFLSEANKTNHIIKVEINSLITTHSKSIKFHKKMKGTGIIMLRESTILQLLLNQ